MRSSHRGTDADDRFLLAVEAIYDTAIVPGKWPVALQAVADVFADVGAVLTYGRDDGRFGVIVSPKLAAGQEEYNQKWYKHDIRATRMVERGYLLNSDALTDDDLGLREELESHPFYLQFLKKFGLRWFAGIGISPDPHMVVAITVQRAENKPPFGPDELAVLARLGWHAEKALRLGMRVMDAETANLGLRETFDRMGMGVCLLDEGGGLVFSNAVADEFLREDLVLSNGRLTARHPSDRREFEKAICAMARGEPTDLTGTPRPILLRRSRSPQPLVVYALPLRPAVAARQEQFLGRVRSIVLGMVAGGQEPADPAIVRDLLGLTLGEARVAALVGSGVSPRDASAALSISEETARTVLKRVYAKTGISRQSELAVLLSKIVIGTISR